MDHAMLMIGRVAQRQVLDRALLEGDSRMVMWMEHLNQFGAGEPGFLSFDLLRRLSRLHVLVTRSTQGLVVHRLPDTGLAVYAGALNEPLEALEPGQHRVCHSALEVRVVLPNQTPYLQLFVFDGPLSQAQWIDGALARAEDVRRGVLHTQANTVMTQQHDEPRLRVWTLSMDETEILIDVICSYRGGGFKRHVLDALERVRGQSTNQKLVVYFEQSARVTQYMVRLCEKADNDPVRVGVQQRFDNMTDREMFYEILPAGLQRLLRR